jgi:hypothetical protein
MSATKPATTVPALDDAIRLAGQLAWVLQQIHTYAEPGAWQREDVEVALNLADRCRALCLRAKGGS